MTFKTRTPGILCVASTYPDPPFEFMDGVGILGRGPARLSVS
jgi:hypothetical protein